MKRMLVSILFLAVVSAVAFSTGQSQAAAPVGDAPIDIEYLETIWNVVFPEVDPIRAALEDRLNIRLTYNGFPSHDDLRRHLNVRLASGNAPDFWNAPGGRTDMLKYVEDGVIADLTPFRSRLADHLAFVGETAQAGTVDGSLYAFTWVPGPQITTLWVRADWLENLGLDIPRTVDDVLEVARAFTFGDPDGNGRQDTFGLSGPQMSTFSFIFAAYGLASPGKFAVEDGQVTNSLQSPRMLEALSKIREFVDAGVVDPELLALRGSEFHDKAIQGSIGMIYIDWARMGKIEYLRQIEAVNPKARWVQIQAPIGPHGSGFGDRDLGGSDRHRVVSVRADRAKVERIADLVNYTATDEGLTLVSFGLEGRHYTRGAEGITMTSEGLSELGYIWVYQFSGRDVPVYQAARFPNERSLIQFATSQPRIPALDRLVDRPDGYNASDANRFIEEELAKFIYGRRPLTRAEYSQFLATLDRQFGYDQYVRHMTQGLNALGY
jgi:putative aldouronate transport system substrate-binding protein